MAATVVIYREQGGSVMRFDSTASLNVAAGGTIVNAGVLAQSGDISQTGGSNIIASGALVTVQSGGCLTNNVSGAEAQTVTIIGTSGLKATLSIGRIAPVHSASPGSLYVRSDGSMSNWYYNIADGTTGSVWRAAASG